MRFFTSVLATASALVATASAQVGFCPNEGKYCMQVAAHSSGNMYFQIAALDSYAWAAFGTGSGMTGSDIMMVYTDGNGNVTVSPRQATGRSQPQANSAVSVQLLAGSGVSGGVMTANFLCSNCASLYDASGSQNFIAAWKVGGGINSNSISANVNKHDAYTRYSLDLSQAALATDANPYLDGANAGNTGNGNTGNTGGNTGITGGDNTGGASSTSSPINLILLHGIVMAVTFIFMYPVGAILMPLVGKWLVHAGWQMVAFMAMWAGFGIGYAKANEFGTLFKQTHTILGTVVCVGMIIQPVIGFLHHRYFKKHQSRGPVSYAHIWYGRLIMFLGILNGGLGLKLAGAPDTFTIAYSVIAAIIGVGYIASAYVGQMRRNRNSKEKFSSSYSPATGAQAYKPQGRVQYSPVQPSFGQGQQPQGQQYGGQYGPRDQYQPSQQYGSYNN